MPGTKDKTQPVSLNRTQIAVAANGDKAARNNLERRFSAGPATTNKVRASQMRETSNRNQVRVNASAIRPGSDEPKEPGDRAGR